MNIAPGRNRTACAQKCLDTIFLGQQLIKSPSSLPPTDHEILPEHINELLDMARYNLGPVYAPRPYTRLSISSTSRKCFPSAWKPK